MNIVRKATNYIFNLFDVSCLYYSIVGVKCFNQVVSSDMFDFHVSEDLFDVEPSELFICVDGLKDAHTLIDTSVTDSPHFDLMKRLSEGRDIRDSDYMARKAAGILDFRQPAKPSARFVAETVKRFHDETDAIKRRNAEPVKVIKVGGCLYIADGKHKAAMRAVLGLNVSCVDATPALYDSFFLWVCRKVEKRPEEYSKHVDFFSRSGMLSRKR